jgi:hypothetical protein
MPLFRCLGALLAGLALTATTPAWASNLGWSDLVPAAAAEDNPFAKLSDVQIDQLRELAVSRMLAQRLGQRSEAIAQRDSALIAALKAEGVDADATLALRETVIAERRARAQAAVPAIDGQPLQLVGYMVPLTVDANRVRDFLLVPWAGACSHTPPPPPNQLLRVRAPEGGLDPVLAQRQVRVAGTLRVRSQVQTVTMVDGVLAVSSSYAIDDATVLPFGEPALPPAGHRVP